MFRCPVHVCCAAAVVCSVPVSYAESVQEAEVWRVYVDDSARCREAEAELEALRKDVRFAHVAWEVVRLGDATTDRAGRLKAAEAIRDLVAYTPSFVLTDRGGMYASVGGAVGPVEGMPRADRRAAAAALRSADRSRLQEQVREANSRADLFLLMGDVYDLPPNADASALKMLIDKVAAFCKDSGRPTVLRQVAALRILYPLLLRKTAVLYDGVHSPRSEAAFNAAVAALEYARDMDRASAEGKQAHALREELRRARLQAKTRD